MIGGLAGLPNDDARKILFVAVVLCLVCSLLVSTAAVLLGPLQDYQKSLNRKRNVLLAAGLVEPGEASVDVEGLFARVEARIVDLETGRFTDAADPATFDQRAAARDPELGMPIADEADVAGLSRRARYAPVYLVRDEAGALERLVLPVSGYGLWSTMYAFLALEDDLDTVAAINFYEQAETPGLGGEVENPRWQALWRGKMVFGDSREPRLRVVKGNVDPSAPGAEYQVDGLSGSTLTSNGVTNMIRYWLGSDGFGPFIERLRSEGV